ncbi:hypothetical protein F8S13_19760 [Chloroflexia bacterium SDU3-3]|nr:hypothetical protein F8S13_19760 [Chloroflexia bacterium SDU3-3]
MDDIVLPMAELPEVMRTWLAEQPAVVISIEQLDEGRVRIRALPGVAPEVIARAQVTMATYREALMNLS